MLSTYLRRVFSHTFRRVVYFTDALQIIVAAMVPLFAHLTGATMSGETAVNIAVYIGLFVAAWVGLRAIAAPYFVWRDDQARIADLEAASPVHEVRRELARELAQLVSKAKRHEPRGAGNAREYPLPSNEAYNLIEQLSYRPDLAAMSEELIGLAQAVVNKIEADEPCDAEQARMKVLGPVVYQRLLDSNPQVANSHSLKALNEKHR